MKKQLIKKLDPTRSQELLKKARQVSPRVLGPLRGQLQVALELRKKGMSYSEISEWLGNNGIPVHATTVCKYVRETGEVGDE